MTVTVSNPKTDQLNLFSFLDSTTIEVPDRIENPSTDNDRLFNIQLDYYEKDKDPDTLWKMFPILNKVAYRYIRKEKDFKKFVMDDADMREKAEDAALKIIDKYRKSNYICEKSVTGLLYLQVLEVLYHMTLAQRFEKYCEENNLNLFAMDDDQKEMHRVKFEKSLNLNKA